MSGLAEVGKVWPRSEVTRAGHLSKNSEIVTETNAHDNERVKVLFFFEGDERLFDFGTMFGTEDAILCHIVPVENGNVYGKLSKVCRDRSCALLKVIQLSLGSSLVVWCSEHTPQCRDKGGVVAVLVDANLLNCGTEPVLADALRRAPASEIVTSSLGKSQRLMAKLRHRPLRIPGSVR